MDPFFDAFTRMLALYRTTPEMNVGQAASVRLSNVPATFGRLKRL